MTKSQASNKVTAGLIMAFLIGATGLMWDRSGHAEDLPKVPPEYAGKKMPAGWWTNPKVIAAGQKIYEGRVAFKKELEKDHKKCFQCHGVDGKPKIRRARDFRAAAKMNTFSDAYWFWRVSEGVPNTKMETWKDYLTEEQIWQVITYEHTFSHDGKPAEHRH